MTVIAPQEEPLSLTLGSFLESDGKLTAVVWLSEGMATLSISDARDNNLLKDYRVGDLVAVGANGLVVSWIIPAAQLRSLFDLNTIPVVKLRLR